MPSSKAGGKRQDLRTGRDDWGQTPIFTLNCRPTAPDNLSDMARNAEVIRQWKLLLHLDGLAHGRAVDELAAELGVNKRTVWRDLAALQEAGF